MRRKGIRRTALLVVCFALAARAATFTDLARQAAAARDADQVPLAIDLYQQALRLDPKWPEGWFYLGTLYYDSDRYSEAQPAFSEFVKLADQPAGWAFLGLCEFETGSYAPARDHLEKALRGGVAPAIESVVRFHQALLLTRLGLFAQAAPVYAVLVNRSIHDPNLIAGLGLNCLNKPMVPTQVPPDQRDFIAAVGRTAYVWVSHDSTPEKTAVAFQALLAEYPTTPGVHYFHASYLLASRPEAAQQELRRELEIDPRAAEARAMLALLLFESGQKAEALDQAKIAAGDAPASPLAQYSYGLTLTDLREAVVHLEIAAGLDTTKLEYHVALAHVYARLGRHEDARRERKTAVRLARQDSFLK